MGELEAKLLAQEADLWERERKSTLELADQTKVGILGDNPHARNPYPKPCS